MDPTQPLLPLDGGLPAVPSLRPLSSPPSPAAHDASRSATAPQPKPASPPATQMPLLLTVRDVEAELQLGRTRTYELVRSGELPVVRVGRAVRVPRHALERWIESRMVVAGDGAD